MAPELISSSANARSDIYSFGVTAFDLHYRPEIDADGSIVYQRPALTGLILFFLFFRNANVSCYSQSNFCIFFKKKLTL